MFISEMGENMKIVLQLQKEALDEEVSISKLLRELLTVCTKLEIDEMIQWVKNEMYGYSDKQSEIPSYRMISGTCQYRNPFHGWSPVVFSSLKDERLFTMRPVNSSVAELEHLLDSEGDFVSMEYSNSFRQKFAADNHGMIPVLIIDKSKVANILSSVRNRVLEFSLNLEKQGVLGDEDLVFSKEEKERVQQMKITNNNIYGNQVVQEGNHNSTVINDTCANQEALILLLQLVEDIEEKLGELQVDEDANAQIVMANLDTLRAQSKSPWPRNVIIREALSSLRQVFENASGTVLASLVTEGQVVSMINRLSQMF